MKSKLQETTDFLSNLKRSDCQGVEESKLYWELVAAARYYTNFLDEQRYEAPKVTGIEVAIEDKEDYFLIYEVIEYSDGDWETYALVRVIPEVHALRLKWVNGPFRNYPEIMQLLERIPSMEKEREFNNMIK